MHTNESKVGVGDILCLKLALIISLNLNIIVYR